MSLRKRAPGLVCLLLLTAAAVLLAGRPTPAAPPSARVSTAGKKRQQNP